MEPESPRRREGRWSVSRSLSSVSRRMVRARASISSFVALKSAEDASLPGDDSVGDNDFIPSRTSSLVQRSVSQSPKKRRDISALNWTVHGDRYPLMHMDRSCTSETSAEQPPVYRSSGILHVSTFSRSRHKRDPSMCDDVFEGRQDIPRSSPIPIRAAPPRLAPLMDVDINTDSLESMISQESSRIYRTANGSSPEHKIFGSLELDDKPPNYEHRGFTDALQPANTTEKAQDTVPALEHQARTSSAFADREPKFKSPTTSFRTDCFITPMPGTGFPLEPNAAETPRRSRRREVRPLPHLSLDAATDQIFHDLEVAAREEPEKVTETVEQQTAHEDDPEDEEATAKLTDQHAEDVPKGTIPSSAVAYVAKSDESQPSPIEGVSVFHQSGRNSPVFVLTAPLDTSAPRQESVESTVCEPEGANLHVENGRHAPDCTMKDPEDAVEDDRPSTNDTSVQTANDGSQDDRSTLRTLKMSQSDEELMEELHRCLKHDEHEKQGEQGEQDEQDEQDEHEEYDEYDEQDERDRKEEYEVYKDYDDYDEQEWKDWHTVHDAHEFQICQDCRDWRDWRDLRDWEDWRDWENFVDEQAKLKKLAKLGEKAKMNKLGEQDEQDEQAKLDKLDERDERDEQAKLDNLDEQDELDEQAKLDNLDEQDELDEQAKLDKQDEQATQDDQDHQDHQDDAASSTTSTATTAEPELNVTEVSGDQHARPWYGMLFRLHSDSKGPLDQARNEADEYSDVQGSKTREDNTNSALNDGLDGKDSTPLTSSGDMGCQTDETRSIDDEPQCKTELDATHTCEVSTKCPSCLRSSGQQDSEGVCGQ